MAAGVYSYVTPYQRLIQPPRVGRNFLDAFNDLSKSDILLGPPWLWLQNVPWQWLTLIYAMTCQALGVYECHRTQADSDSH